MVQAMTTSLPTITLILAILAVLGLFYALWQIASLNRLRKNFFAGTQALNLESVIESLRIQMEAQGRREFELEEELKKLKTSFGFSVQKLGLVRFNPFADGGGNFSFTLAVLDLHDNGLILTSMHGREQNRIYAKRIIAGSGETQLTEEEEQAITLAHSRPSASMAAVNGPPAAKKSRTKTVG